jgi:outer membrane protein TolC
MNRAAVCLGGVLAGLWLGLSGGLGEAQVAERTSPPTSQEPPLKKREELPPPRKVVASVPPTASSILSEQYSPIDLDSALRLAGVRNPEILLARERVTEAVALHQLAAVKFLPSLNSGVSVDTHTGPVQQSAGTILPVNRGALYLGMGAYAVAAGTVQIPGLVVSGNVSEQIFAALITRQVVRQREFASQAVRNDQLLRVANAYLELLRAEGRRAVLLQTRDQARELTRVLAAYTNRGQGRLADADRAAATFTQRDAEVLEAERQMLAASARLAQLLDLDPTVRLRPAERWVVPAPLVPDAIPLPELLAIALTQRPELAERQAAIRAALLALRDAQLLPFSPDVVVGYSVGTFGGGSNLVSAGILRPDGTLLQEHRFGNFGDRQDFDAIVYWSLQNLGLGNLARVRLAQSHLRSEQLRRLQILDQIRAEVASAYAASHARFAQIETAERALAASQRAFQKDLERTRNNVGLPIEVLDSLRLLGLSRLAYVDAIIDYNEAQFALYVALGQPPANRLARPVPAALLAPAPESETPRPTPAGDAGAKPAPVPADTSRVPPGASPASAPSS